MVTISFDYSNSKQQAVCVLETHFISLHPNQESQSTKDNSTSYQPEPASVIVVHIEIYGSLLAITNLRRISVKPLLKNNRSKDKKHYLYTIGFSHCFLS